MSLAVIAKIWGAAADEPIHCQSNDVAWLVESRSFALEAVVAVGTYSLSARWTFWCAYRSLNLA
jgi:hypothetical protein